MKYALLVIVFLFSCSVARGQAGQATEIRSGPTNPTTCNVQRGWLFWNTTNSTMNECTATNTWSSLTTGGGNGTGAGAGPVMGFYLSPNCPPANTGQCFFTSANTQQDVTASWGTGSPTITITDGKFVAGDVGKRAYGYVTCNAFSTTLNSNAGSGAITTGTVVTITGFTDSNHVTISANPANAVSNVANVGGCFIWGTPDDSGAAALSTAVAAGVSCPKVFLAAGYYMLTTPPGFMINNPASCAHAAAGYGGTFGNIYYEAGMEIEGRGRENTVLYLTPGFPETGTCTNGLGGIACFVRVLEGRWADFTMTGGQNANTNAGNVVLIESDGPGSFDNFNCYNWKPNQSNTYGFDFHQGWDQLRQVDNSGCGGNGMYVTAGFPVGYNVRVENSGYAAITLAASSAFECHSCGFYTPQFASAANPIVAIFNSGSVICYDCDVQDGGITSGNPKIGVQNQNVAGVAYRQFGGDIKFGSATGYSAIVSLGANDTFLEKVFNITAGATGNTYKDTLGTSRLFDLGANIGLYSSGGGTSIAGKVFGEANSANLSSLVTGNIVLSANWGTGNTQTAFTGGDFPSQFTITNGSSGTGASPTIAYTFPTPLAVSPYSCTATQVGGTNSTGTFTSSALSKTGVTFTFSLTPTASNTEIVQMTCVTP